MVVIAEAEVSSEWQDSVSDWIGGLVTCTLMPPGAAAESSILLLFRPAAKLTKLFNQAKSKRRYRV